MEGGGRQPALEERRLHVIALAPHEEWTTANPLRERAVLSDHAGRIITRKEGDSEGIDWTVDALRPLVGRVDPIIHNHPHGRSIGESDLALTLHLNAREVNALGAVQRFWLRRIGENWPDTDELVSVVVEERERLAAEMVKARDEGTIDDQGIEHLFHHLLWGRVARRYPDRVRYEVEKRE